MTVWRGVKFIKWQFAKHSIRMRAKILLPLLHLTIVATVVSTTMVTSYIFCIGVYVFCSIIWLIQLKPILQRSRSNPSFFTALRSITPTTEFLLESTGSMTDLKTTLSCVLGQYVKNISLNMGIKLSTTLNLRSGSSEQWRYLFFFFGICL